MSGASVTAATSSLLLFFLIQRDEVALDQKETSRGLTRAYKGSIPPGRGSSAMPTQCSDDCFRFARHLRRSSHNTFA